MTDCRTGSNHPAGDGSSSTSVKRTNEDVSVSLDSVSKMTGSALTCRHLVPMTCFESVLAAIAVVVLWVGVERREKGERGRLVTRRLDAMLLQRDELTPRSMIITRSNT